MYIEGVPHAPTGRGVRVLPACRRQDFPREGGRQTVEGWAGGWGAIGYIVGRALFGRQWVTFRLRRLPGLSLPKVISHLVSVVGSFLWNWADAGDK